MKKRARLKDRYELIREIVRGRVVLDVGCASRTFRDEYLKSGLWLHEVICKSAKYVLGVDNFEEGVQTLQKLGYNIVLGNVEDMKLDKKFEIVVPGEIIEHLSNAGDFRLTARLCPYETSFLRV